MSRSGHRWRPMPVLLLVLVAGGLVWGGWAWWDRRRSRRALAEARSEIQAGRPGHAVQKLAALLAWQPDWDEAAYLLGSCEKARGRAQAAAAAWTRIPPGSPFTAAAIQGRVELAIQRGRFADVERLMEEVAGDPRIDAFPVPPSLALAYCQQGRSHDAERLTEASWDRLERAGEGASERAIQLLRLHLLIRLEPIPVAALRASLDRAARRAPDDDRMGLARANLAIRAGAHDEAARWLDACLRRRPEDVPAWRARLSWAVATNQVAEVRRAAPHIPAAMPTPAEVHRLEAWLAARRGDAETERTALERLVAADPADFPAWDRLVELTSQDGRPDRAAELCRQKAEILQIRARYQKLNQRNQPIRDAAEMAGLAHQLGQRFEAQAFLTIAVAADPQRQDLRGNLARLKQQGRIRSRAGRTLAEALAPGRNATDPTSQEAGLSSRSCIRRGPIHP